MPVSMAQFRRLERQVEYLLNIAEGEVVTPRRFGKLEQIDFKKEGDVHYIKLRQNFAPLPPNVVRQEFVALENGTEIFRQDVADGGQAEFWAEVGATVERTLQYFDQAGTGSEVFRSSMTLVDNYNAPVVAPVDIPEAEQVDEQTDAAARPTA